VRKAGDLLRGRQIVQGDEVEEFWALKNVRVEIKQGEVLGIMRLRDCLEMRAIASNTF